MPSNPSGERNINAPFEIDGVGSIKPEIWRPKGKTSKVLVRCVVAASDNYMRNAFRRTLK